MGRRKVIIAVAVAIVVAKEVRGEQLQEWSGGRECLPK